MKHTRSIMSITMATIVLVSLCVVLSSPSVTAAEGNSANIQSGLVGAPAGIVGAPAVCSQGANSLDLFVNGTDGALWYKHWNNTAGWSGWTSLGGHLTSSPAATVVPGERTIYVFARGSDGALYCRETGDGGTTWYPWWRVGGQLLAGTGPTVYAWGYKAGSFIRYGWFVTGTDHVLWHAWVENAVIHDWESVGGYLTSSPAATSSGRGTIDVAGRGSNGALYTRHFSGGVWGSWTNLGGKILAGTSPAASNWGSSRTDWFVTGTNHQLYHSWTGHPGWENLGGYLTSSPGATSRSPGTIDVFVRGSNGALYQKTYNGGWSNWTSIGGM